MREKTARRFLNRNSWKLAVLRKDRVKNALTKRALIAQKVLDKGLK